MFNLARRVAVSWRWTALIAIHPGAQPLITFRPHERPRGDKLRINRAMHWLVTDMRHHK
jgi:hypothetical protein